MKTRVFSAVIVSMFIGMNASVGLASNCNGRVFSNSSITDGDFASRYSSSLFLIEANGRSGTGFLIADNVGLSAKHTFLNDDGTVTQTASIRFVGDDAASAITLTADDLELHEEKDVVLLFLPKSSIQRRAMELAFAEADYENEESVALFGLSGNTISQAYLDPPSPTEGKMTRLGTERATASYESASGDSGGPVVLRRRNIVGAVHIGFTRWSNQRKIIRTLDLEDWIARKMPRTSNVEMLRKLRELDEASLVKGFIPGDCRKQECWETAEIIGVTEFVSQHWQEMGEVPSNRLRCPLLRAAKHRSLWSAIIKLVGRVQAIDTKYVPTSSDVDAIRKAMREISTKPTGAVPKQLLATTYQTASSVFSTAAVADIVDSGERAIGRLCGQNQDGEYDLNLFAKISDRLARVKRSERGYEMGWPKFETTDVACNSTYSNEYAASLLFDAAVAKKRYLDLNETIQSVAAQDVSLSYSAAAALTQNKRRQFEALLGIAEVAKPFRPDFAAKMTATAYATGINPELSSKYYDYLKAVAETNDERLEALPRTVALAAEKSPKNYADIFVDNAFSKDDWTNWPLQ